MKLLFTLMLCFVCTLASAQVTADDVLERIETTKELKQASDKLMKFLIAVERLLRLEENDNIDLTSEQKMALLQNYNVLKGAIQTLYNDLP